MLTIPPPFAASRRTNGAQTAHRDLSANVGGGTKAVKSNIWRCVNGIHASPRPSSNSRSSSASDRYSSPSLKSTTTLNRSSSDANTSTVGRPVCRTFQCRPSRGSVQSRRFMGLRASSLLPPGGRAAAYRAERAGSRTQEFQSWLRFRYRRTVPTSDGSTSSPELPHSL